MVPYANTVPASSTIDCFAIPSLHICFIRAHIDGALGAHNAGAAWTAAHVIDSNYFPSENVDLYGSCSSNVPITPFLWSDGQIVIKSQSLATKIGDSFSFSGFWTY